MSFPVLKNAGYVLVHTPDMIVRNGSTCAVERVTNPNSEFLTEINKFIRSYDDVVNYLPNQVYIGNVRPEELNNYEMPWSSVEYKGDRKGKFGDIATQEEFIGLIQMCDAFDLVVLKEDFVNQIKPKIEALYPELEPFFAKLKAGSLEEAPEMIAKHLAEGLYNNDELVGYVKAAHDVDVNLNAHTIFENLVVKASGVMAALQLLRQSDVPLDEIEYVIECSEEACGDINQRGGGNFAKAIAEMVNLQNATGSDTRSFCAGPTHALIEAAALVQAGVFKNVLVVAGGASAKLGMNAKDHIKKDLPVLEDVVAGFAILISKNDGVHPIFRTDLVGRHTVGTGSSPQAVMTALITSGLDRANLGITDVDTYSVEMQNPDITKPAGAGNVPESNYKMIAALAVKKGEIDKKDLLKLMEEKGLPGWAPTQGHVPSGVPYIAFLIEDLTSGSKNRAMVVGKGSLFLGRMTNLFDGVSFVAERNPGVTEAAGSISTDEIKKIIAESMRKLATNMTE